MLKKYTVTSATSALALSALAILTGCAPLPPGANAGKLITAEQYFFSNQTQVNHSFVDTLLNQQQTVAPGAYIFHLISYTKRQIPEVKMLHECEAVSNYWGNTNYRINPGNYKIQLVYTNPVTHVIQYGLNWGLTPDLGGPVDNWLFITPDGNVAKGQSFQMPSLNDSWNSWPGTWSMKPKGCRFTLINSGKNVISDLKVYYMGRTPSGLLQFQAQNGPKAIVPAQPGNYTVFGAQIHIIDVHHFELTYELDDEGDF